MRFPAAIERLISLFSRLPSVGPKTAERYVFYLLKQSPAVAQELATALAELPRQLRTCSVCQRVSENDPCSICSDVQRDNKVLCIVADSRDLFTIEDTDIFKGYYYVLGGMINALQDIKPPDINIQGLVERIKVLKPKEVVLALDPTLEGETTTLYLTKLLKPAGIKITRLAKGLSSGANIEYADELTLRHALKFRSEV